MTEVPDLDPTSFRFLFSSAIADIAIKTRECAIIKAIFNLEVIKLRRKQLLRYSSGP